MFAVDNFGGHFYHVGKDEGSSKQLGLDFQVRVCHLSPWGGNFCGD